MRARRNVIVSLCGAAVIFGGGFLLGVFRGDREPPLTHEPLPLAEVSQPAAETPPFDPSSWEYVTVQRVIDGDTVVLDNDERMRLIGIDAPEQGACYSDLSAERLGDLVLGRRVRWERGLNERDRYGRLLGYLHDGSTFVNLLMVERGWAVAYPYPPDTVYAVQFAEAERRAREAKRGLWGACGGLDTRGVPDLQGSSENVAPTSCVVKGNIAADGERVYHVPGCGSYDRTQIHEARGERWFCSEQEAQAAGWRKARNCP